MIASCSPEAISSLSRSGVISSPKIAQHVDHDPNTPPGVAHYRYPDSCRNQISESSHRRRNDCQALGE
jgi:hypothetical protein